MAEAISARINCRDLHRGRLVRTTLNLNNDLLAKAKASAAREHLSLTRLIEEGLALRLRQSAKATPSARPMPLPVYRGQGGLTAAVADARSNRQLLDAADGLPRPCPRM
jgi:hypothetical protein